MATVYKVLGQSAPAATTNTNVYTVPSGTTSVVSTIAVCNRGITTNFRVAVRPAGATLANEHYIIYDTPVNANDSVFITIGTTVNATDVITVYAGTANLSFSLFGSEVS